MPAHNVRCGYKSSWKGRTPSESLRQYRVDRRKQQVGAPRVEFVYLWWVSRIKSAAGPVAYEVLDSVSSPITKRVYNLGLGEFFAWYNQAPRPGLTAAETDHQPGTPLHSLW